MKTRIRSGVVALLVYAAAASLVDAQTETAVRPKPDVIATNAPTADKILRVFVTGKVAEPGKFQLTNGMRITDVVAQAGGITESSAVMAELVRLNPANGKLIRITLFLDEGSRSPRNVEVRDLDAIRVR